MKTKKFHKNMKFGAELKKKFKLNGGKKIEYWKDFKKIWFESNDNLPLNRPIKLRSLTTIIRCVFREHDKFYPQLFLDDVLYELM